MKILRIILLLPLALFRLLLFLSITFYVVYYGNYKRRKHGYSRELQIWSMQVWGKWVLKITGIRESVSDKPLLDGSYIVMPNHRSYIDVPLIVKLHQGTLIGKTEVSQWPMARSAAKIARPIMVNRSDIRSLVETMKKIKDSVENNIPVILFPEGTTYEGPLTKPFKSGSFKIAADAGVPVIPVAIHYPDKSDAWIDDDTFLGHFFKQMGKIKTRVIVRYGKPVINSDHKILKNEVRNQINEMLKEMTGTQS